MQGVRGAGSQRCGRTAGSPACPVTTAITLCLCGHRSPCRGGVGGALQHTAMPAAQQPSRTPGRTGVGAQACGGGEMGRPPGRQWPLPPKGPFRLATSSEWAGCGIPVILCRAGMWKPEPWVPWRGEGWGGGHSTEVGGGRDTRPVRQVCGEEGPAHSLLGSRPPAASTAPPAFN